MIGGKTMLLVAHRAAQLGGLTIVDSLCAVTDHETKTAMIPARRGMTDVFDESTPFRRVPRRKQAVHTDPYRHLTAEQRAWNQAVDERNAAKKAGRK